MYTFYHDVVPWEWQIDNQADAMSFETKRILRVSQLSHETAEMQFKILLLQWFLLQNN
jgi:hypothetical protein